MNSATAAERDPRTLVLLGLALVIWLGSTVRSQLPVSPLFLPTSKSRGQFVTAGQGMQSDLAAVNSDQGRNPAALALVSFQPIPINRADREALIALDGIGPVLADRILEWRTAHGKFRTADDILAVRGIGPKKLAKILPQISFD
ncbi:MAG TPA: helix-hairpin-helix domain-containing protein [Desulfurivibrionaceae bacterium]|nr:helix-hairpin-helix domain-containing protein [Desulfurivibrionaceae bacterium]